MNIQKNEGIHDLSTMIVIVISCLQLLQNNHFAIIVKL